jgi:hypothetical protein
MALARLRALARGSKDVRSDDPRDVQRVLDRELKRRMADTGDPVQFIGMVHTQASYAQWRSEQLARIPGATVPTVPTQRWPLVLWVMRPANAPEFLRHGRAQGLYVSPQVGMFAEEVARDVALAAAIGSYLEDLSRPVQIAPPILGIITRGRVQYRIATLDRTWTLPAAEVIGIRR